MTQGKDWNPDQIREYQKYWDSLLMGPPPIYKRLWRRFSAWIDVVRKYFR
jgi:hypothetical protein